MNNLDMMQLKMLNEYFEEPWKEDWIDGDRLTCLKCDRFVSEINGKSVCQECVEK